MEQPIRVVEIRAGGMRRRIAVRETDAEIRATVDALYPKGGTRLDIWLAIERELCPVRVEALARA